MRIGESFGEACRYCGSTMIIVEPLQLAGNCARCSTGANHPRPWADRLAAAAGRQKRRTSSAFENRLGAEAVPAVVQNPGGRPPLFGRLPPRQRSAPAASAEEMWRVRPAGSQLTLPGFGFRLH
jgi:hypothetical protein